MTRHRNGPGILDPAKLAAARRDRHLSRDDLAGHLGVTAGTIAAYEQGRTDPSASVLIRMGWLFGINPEKLCRTREAFPAAPAARVRRSRVA